MTKRVVFFNYFHNGDIHVSRGLIRQIINKVKQIDPNIEFAYSHKMAVDLLFDISDLKFDSNGLSVVNNEHTGVLTVGDTTYINTWYGQQQFKYMNRHQISFDTLYAALNDSCKAVWGFSLDEISTDPTTFFPIIEYNKFHIRDAQNWLNNHTGSKIFVSNGMALSDQSHNFELSPLVENLARKYPNKTFILSNVESHKVSLSNVFYSTNIIKRSGCDLNENAFLSEHCDTIMGRASGAFAFAETQNNMFKRQCKILCFTNIVPQKTGQFWLADLMQDKIKYSASITATNESNTNIIQKMMEEHL